jgi:osmotically inducible protein OsmC
VSAVRRAEVIWEGSLARGSGKLSAASSGAFSNLPVTWGSRIEHPDGRTSPEELLAAAHASCFAMALSFALGNAGSAPERLTVSAEVTFDRVDGSFKVLSSALTVVGRVPGLDADAFHLAAEGARENCPISQALKGNVQLSVQTSLENDQR